VTLPPFEELEAASASLSDLPDLQEILFKSIRAHAHSILLITGGKEPIILIETFGGDLIWGTQEEMKGAAIVTPGAKPLYGYITEANFLADMDNLLKANA